jgi:outer membrane receptor for ferrienterochelin and colicin
MPTNGRNYLDLMQLVPGVVVNRQANVGSDNSTPVLGERAGNNNFLIDGQPNKDTVTGGAASQFNQETIAEFQVLTAGFRAEFGQASGAIVNVITRSGTNDYHGRYSFATMFSTRQIHSIPLKTKRHFYNAGTTVSPLVVQS